MPTEAVAMAKQMREFQAEVKQLLHIVINSLYTHKEIFLRELIANASDALDKLRVLALTDTAVLEDSSDLSIFIETDPANRILKISDNGIGMSYEEVLENIGTIREIGFGDFHATGRQSGRRESRSDRSLWPRFLFGVHGRGEAYLLTRPRKARSA